MTSETLISLITPFLAQAEGAPPGNGAMMQFLILGLLFAGMWFLIIAPQRKKQKQLDAMIKALKQGDEIVTTGGIFGTVASIRSDRFIIRVADNTRIEFSKNAIAAVVNKKGEKSDNNVKDLEDSADDKK